MAPILLVALVAGSLFTSGVAVKPYDHNVGTVLEAAGVGTAIGGAVGAIGGVATAVGVSTTAAITGGAIAGGVTTPLVIHEISK